MPYLEVLFNLPLPSPYTYHSRQAAEVGCRVEAPLGRRLLTGWVVGCPDTPPQGITNIRDIKRVVDTRPLFDSRLLNLSRWLADLLICAPGEALSAMLPGGRREVDAWASDDNPNDEAGDEKAENHTNVYLTKTQRAAIQAVGADTSGWFYLYGNTGSGKTEVFLRSAERVIENGGSVIYLVPEIALSHHLVESLSSRFSGTLAVIHSGLTPSKRLSEWRRIQSGSARLVLGARSAVFAPVDRLGLIVIDEEHEGSYKSSSTPRYHARQAAMRRCREEKAALIMGSATPSVEAWHLMQSGRLRRLELRGRPAGGAAPAVDLVDMRSEKGILSGPLIQAMSRVLGSGRQVLLFLNRRGFSYRCSCASCGAELHCRSCTVPLTFHKSRGAMICHYCGFRCPVPSHCPSCGAVQMRAAGFGTEKIEEEVSSLFPEKQVVRLDADSARKKGAAADALKRFRRGSIDVLLGTQMVTKGLNAPGVKLAAILAADAALNIPDFRSAERAFALILQVAGRAGRFRPDGEVIVQTLNPSAAAVRFAAENRVSEFYDYEIEQRRLLGFPPFSRLFRIVVRGKNEARVLKTAEELARLTDIGKDWEVLGPAECPIGMISGSFRYHVILRSSRFDQSHRSLVSALDALTLPAGVRLEVDVDPVNLT